MATSTAESDEETTWANGLLSHFPADAVQCSFYNEDRSICNIIFNIEDQSKLEQVLREYDSGAKVSSSKDPQKKKKQKVDPLLRANSTSSTGEACVAACQNLSGWVIRQNRFVFFEMLNVEVFYWGKLVEKVKNWSVMNL